jgi:type IV pilus assembly protein PilM
MVNLKKEIKLSDLRPKRKPSTKGSVPVANGGRGRTRMKDVVGVKVGSSQLAAAEVVNDGVPRLVKVAREALEPGVVVAGEVRDIPALGRALDDFFKKYDLPRKNVRLGIGTNRVGVRALNVEGIDDERQLANAVTFRAHETLAIPMDQAVMDYHVVRSEATSDGGVSRRVILAAAYREPIDHFYAAFDAAGIELQAVDVEAFALLRAVAPPHAHDGAEQTAVVALALGHDRTTLAISDGFVCDFTRVLEWGGSRLDAAIARELGVTIEESAEIKESLSLSEDDDVTSTRARSAVHAELTNLARELVASLQFYQAQPESLALSEILVTGGTTRMPGLVDELERLVRARVRLADPLAAVNAGGGVESRDDLGSLAIAIGLGVER